MNTYTPTDTTASPRVDLADALGLNALASMATGGLLAAAPGSVGAWLGVDIDGWLRLLGVALIAHAVFLAWARTHEQITRLGLLNLAVIAPYPLLMLALVATSSVPRALGQGLVLADGVLVGVMAALQFFALRQRRGTRLAT